MREDGNISPWIEEQEAAILGLKADLRPVAGLCQVFTRRLEQDSDAGRLRGNVVPQLALFVMQAVGSPVEARLLELIKKQGEGLRKRMTPAARRDWSEQTR